MTPYDLTLDQMLADPIVRQLMERDGVGEAQVRGLSDHVRRRRGPGRVAVSPHRLGPEPRSFAP